VIIQGFEIENWACIKKLTVNNLPATGVIVIHAPNRTGKSSLVKALRACLMDYASSSSSAALKSAFPRGAAEKPTVSVTFSVKGTAYRIKKCFGTSKSELASMTSPGAWKVETTSEKEAHSRVCTLAGGNDSAKGLNQLLWLTQAEFQLPDAKKFDPQIQAQLRGILGVLQTPLDDQFIRRVKEHWNTWYAGQRKAGKQASMKANCKLLQQLEQLAAANKELEESKSKFNEVEASLRRIDQLDIGTRNLQLKLEQQTTEREKLGKEREVSRSRIEARKLAMERHKSAEVELAGVVDDNQKRTEAVQRLAEDERKIEPAQAKADEIALELKYATEELERLRTQLATIKEQRRELQIVSNRVTGKLSALRHLASLDSAQKALDTAKRIVEELQRIQKYLDDNPAPDEKLLRDLRVNRDKCAQFRADLKAASISLRLFPQADATGAELAIDGETPSRLPGASPEIAREVRRKAELQIAGWGRIEIRRGAGADSLENIERTLQGLEKEFAKIMGPFGISLGDPTILDGLTQRSYERKDQLKSFADKNAELKRTAPDGIASLSARVHELNSGIALQTDRQAAESEGLPGDQAALEELATRFRLQLEALERDLGEREKNQVIKERALDQLRNRQGNGQNELAACKANVNRRREELGRMRSEEAIAARIEAARSALELAQNALAQTELTPEELTLEDRVRACAEAVNALKMQVRDNENESHKIRGRLESSEGLHSRRAALGARVDELKRVTEADILERDATDRLYELFEECRDKQIGTLMEPIHDRVLNWMRVLGIGDYKQIHFSDAFLPNKLVRGDGTAEFDLDEESTGAQEQIGMLVRLALGSLLTSAGEPAVAILDDPLTHCDLGRLNKMRVILRRAAEGDAKQDPPAGPLQIIILTCHPEGFRDEKATVIDLENEMERFGG
jgi:hypothetical protein